ncbi:CrcB family protein [Bdellovibrio sp. 22V]|uniref:fluoride efflux transporter FluC n=1 Tax=Bdellovibrio sp. 22V TaxID=3044166 RepID=UPI002542BC80|nr:CrcB family protein [Bdellovibrio sp. 22V]WII71307.1 CrcB family protein [Bdellovibrio sp. 22V]
MPDGRRKSPGAFDFGFFGWFDGCMQIFWIGLFGLGGIFCRYGVDRWLAPTSAGFPLSTFLINILGCSVAGVIYAVGERGYLSQTLLTGLMVGFCGGFTTFSAYALQSFDLLQKGKLGMSLGYLFASPALGLLACYVAVLATRKLI